MEISVAIAFEESAVDRPNHKRGLGILAAEFPILPALDLCHCLS